MPTEDIFTHQLFQGLEPASIEKLKAAFEPREVRRGGSIVKEGDEANELFILVAGEVAIRQKGSLTRLSRAPDVLGLAALMTGQNRTASLDAFTDVTLAVITRVEIQELFTQSAAFASNVVRLPTQDLARMYEREATWRRYMADFFESPHARLVPGPYAADTFDMVFLIMQGKEERLRELLPPGVTLFPGLGSTYLLTFSFFPKVYSTNPKGHRKQFAYKETAPFIPVLGPYNRLGYYCPELYPDNYLAITLGREIYGFPKRFGTTEHTRPRIEDTPQQVNVIIDNRLVVRADWKASSDATLPDLIEKVCEDVVPRGLFRQLAAQAAGSLYELAIGSGLTSVPVLVRKQIPDVTSEQQSRYAIDMLVEIPFVTPYVRDIRLLEDLTVNCLDPDHFLQGTCRGGFMFKTAFSFGRGKSRRDYLAAPEPGVVERLLKRAGR